MQALTKERFSTTTVASHFDRGAERYDLLATVQQNVALALFEKVKSDAERASCIVDLGCGTGQLLGLFQQHGVTTSMIGVDLSSSMLTKMRRRAPQATPLQADLTATGLQSRSSDLVVSSSAIQWVDPALAFKEAARLLADEGTLAVACFGRGSIARWRALWGLPRCFMPTQADMGRAATLSGFSIVELATQTYSPVFKEFDAAVASIRELGAGASHRQSKGLLSRTKLAQIKRAFYEEVAQQGGFAMHYYAHFLIAKKSASVATSEGL